MQSNHARRPNGTATFSVGVGIVRVSGLRHGTIEVVSSSLLGLTLQNCVVCTLTLWFAGQPDHCGLRNVGSYDRRHQCLCLFVDSYSASPVDSRLRCAGCASAMQTEMSIAGACKQLRLSSDCGQGPGDCSRRTDRQWQKPGGRTC